MKKSLFLSAIFATGSIFASDAVEATELVESFEPKSLALDFIAKPEANSELWNEVSQLTKDFTDDINNNQEINIIKETFDFIDDVWDASQSNEVSGSVAYNIYETNDVTQGTGPSEEPKDELLVRFHVTCSNDTNLEGWNNILAASNALKEVLNSSELCDETFEAVKETVQKMMYVINADNKQSLSAGVHVSLNSSTPQN